VTVNIPFWKMHGASNDFILIDDRDEHFPVSDNSWITQIAARRTGVGCEGIILIQPSDIADFRMRFFNPDGTEVEMCGNGARCVARLAGETGAAPAKMSIDTVAGILKAEVLDNNVRLLMTAPKDWQTDKELKIGDRDLTYGFVNTGVPHTVVEVDSLETYNVAETGAAIRYHDAFAPKGTNANFITVTGPNSLEIRTYERGVEAETLACGTGIVASALIAARMNHVKPPVNVTAASGDILIVDFEIKGDTAENVTLLGPAVHVFKGQLQYP
jgi:diaminopimelate epimerase